MFLGRISFSFYIFHFAALGCIGRLGSPFEAAVGKAVALLAIEVLTLLVAGGVAAITFRWIEQPIIAAGRTAQISMTGVAELAAATAAG